MKNIKTYEDFLNEGLVQKIFGSRSSLEKEFEKQLKIAEEISTTISTAKDFKEKLKSIQKENSDVAKQFKQYFELAPKAKSIVAEIKKVGLSNKTKKAEKQLKSLTNFVDTLKAGFNNIKTLDKKTKKGFEQNEGIGTVIGNVLRNVLTGQFAINLIKNAKTNLMDANQDMTTLKDVFDINDY